MKSFDGIHEVFEGDVQYPYADIGAPELLHISSVNQENRRDYDYICPYCKKTLRPRLGKYRAHCFAHKKGESCELDRYIHKTAEELLEQKWNRDEPFEISMKVRYECESFEKCFFRYDSGWGCVKEEFKTFDLKKQFNRCLVEKKVGDFIPDLCLIDDSGKHDPIFIEIWSKHKNSEKKAESNHRIIEIRIKTTDELKGLTEHPITESETVTFSHFKTLKKEPDKNDGPKLIKYTLYAESFKSYIDIESTNCQNYNTRHHPRAIFEAVCRQDTVSSPLQFRTVCNAAAIGKGYDLRLCYLCKEYGTEKWNPLYDHNEPFIPSRHIGCLREIKTIGLIQCKQEDARTCAHFRINKDKLNWSITEFNYFDKYIWYKNMDGSASEEYLRRKADTEPISANEHFDLNFDIDSDF